MGPPELPDGYEIIRRDGWRIALRPDVEEALLAAGGGDPAALAATGTVAFTGRGRPVLVTLADGTRSVLRRYLHGGLLRWITGRLFLGPSRPFGELRAIERARQASVSVPEVLAAYHRQRGLLLHEGYILTREVEEARDLVDHLRSGGAAGPPLSHVGRETRRMHEAGVWHSDLHVKNVLLRNAEVTLLDFDRARVLDPVPTRLRYANLLRFDRSVEKLTRTGVVVSVPDRMRFFAGYFGGEVGEAERRVLRARCRRSRGWHRLWWGLMGK